MLLDALFSMIFGVLIYVFCVNAIMVVLIDAVGEMRCEQENVVLIRLQEEVQTAVERVCAVNLINLLFLFHNKSLR